MNVYVVLIIWFIFWGSISNMVAKPIYVGVDRYENRTNMFMAIITFSFLILIAGLRNGMADTGAYLIVFDDIPDNFKELYTYISIQFQKSQGFYFLAGLIKCFISDDFHVWLFILATINGLCVAFTLQKNSCNFAISALLFILTAQFTWMVNGLKQFFVATIMFSMTGLILNKKIIPYMLLVVVMTFFHTTALIFIPIYFIVQGEAWNKRTVLFIIFIILAILFAGRFTHVFNEIVENTSYNNSMKLLSKTDDGTNIIRIFIEAIPTIIAFLYRDKIKKIATPIINLCINMSIMGTGIYIISKIVSSGIMIGRLPIYFILYNLILLPWLIENIFEKEEKRLIYYTMIICYLVFFYYQIVIAWDGLPYKSDILTFFK